MDFNSSFQGTEDFWLQIHFRTDRMNVEAEITENAMVKAYFASGANDGVFESLSDEPEERQFHRKNVI
jgi:hypothetical protein